LAYLLKYLIQTGCSRNPGEDVMKTLAIRIIVGVVPLVMVVGLLPLIMGFISGRRMAQEVHKMRGCRKPKQSPGPKKIKALTVSSFAPAGTIRCPHM